MEKVEIKGWICGPKIYEYKNWMFEESYMSGPWPLKKDGEPRKRAGKKFWDVWTQFNKLTDKQKRKYKLSGGCTPLY